MDADSLFGAQIEYFKEVEEKLTLDEALNAFQRGDATDGGTSILATGIGSDPVWVHLAFLNRQSADLTRCLTIENALLDEVDIYFVEAGLVTGSYSLGDSKPFAQRERQERFFTVDHSFKPGITDVYLRIATVDPIVLPIYVRDNAQAESHTVVQNYSYGFLYGYLVALLVYNTILFITIKDRRYLLYAGFMAAFVAMNLSYTGHGFQWLWPDHVWLQRWIIPNLMMLFMVLGLMFARSYLDTPRTLPQSDRNLMRLIIVFLFMFGVACVFGQTQFQALLVAFAFVLVFSVSMLFLGIWAVFGGVQNAYYFLLASLASAVGASLTALSVWGIISFDAWRYRAVEIGMVIDATLLAIALGVQFRLAQLRRIRAEIASKELAEVNRKLSESLVEVQQLAATDRLTGLWNRHHFENAAEAEMDRALRYHYATSLLIFDADHFKGVNDTCGHQAGDEILKVLAQLVRGKVRESDTLTRWGGEEFTVLMPDTPLSAATDAGEKIRQAVAAHTFPLGITLTVSVGVAEWVGEDETLACWIDRADNALYQAKRSGRNAVVAAPLPPEWTALQGGLVKRLNWNPRYESGNAEIDTQHRQLFIDANKVLKLLPGLARIERNPPSSSKILPELQGSIDALLVDVERHFATEEQILEENNWQDLSQHRIVHAKLLAQARECRRLFKEDPCMSSAVALADFVVIELIANHILRSDRSYFPLLSNPCV
jgi:diguanylate cyclase (GGDEF)-like protein/hemerythrin-like metal-binding protein